jgi:hypothetical protein
MKNHEPILTLALDRDSAIAFIKLCLFQKGFQAQQHFELNSACATFSDPLCNCQLITLQAYQSGLRVVPIILHSHEDLTEVFYAEEDVIPADVLAALKQAELCVQHSSRD